ncbi:chromate transporter [Rhodopseudomonas palustris]|uniref:chromate transporter n=1 Tax=Rhodopseudomonas palustris TaxID=1076 RepID=UPI002ACED245|nr:chromate transporter [Rhodopseudomonas palustris]WQH01484.1 chromate transporter [Rhodopseudomonas palustris]
MAFHAPASVADSPAPRVPRPQLGELFVAFAKMSLAGFGGVLMWARRGIVEKHRWMTADEFNDTFALCHFLPGPNIVNLSVVFGARIRGIPGALAAFTGLVAPPVLIVTILAALYARYGEIDALRRTLAGVTCVAVGLLFAVGFKMMLPLLRKRDPVAVLLLVAVFVAIGVLRLPLPAVLSVMAPLGIAASYLIRRRRAP